MALPDGTFRTWEQAEKEAREANPQLDTALTEADQVVERYVDPLIQLFGELEEKAAQQPIASRFRRDKGPDFLRAGIAEESVNPSLRGLSEAEHKRAQLVRDVRELLARALILRGDLKAVYMDMWATEQEG